MNKNKIIIVLLTCIIIVLGAFIFFNFIKEDKKDQKVFNIDCGDNCNSDVKGDRTDNPEPTPGPGGNTPCTGDNCSPSDIPCTGDNCVPGNTPCTGDNCVPNNTPCTGDNCTSNTSECTGDNCVPSSANCTGDNCVIGDGNGNSSEPAAPIEETEDFFVSDNTDRWSQQDEINIFDVPGIAPGYKGTYDFAINNNTKSTAIYYIIFEETNIHGANVLYKLKRNGEYIAGDEDTYVSYSELNVSNRTIFSNEKENYTVEWKWVDADNDTEVGRTPNATYTLKISVNAYGAKGVLGDRTDNPFTGDKLLFYISVGLFSFLLLILMLLIKKEVNKNENSK